MAHWDANSPELQRNLLEVGRTVTADARNRKPLSSESIRGWQLAIMRGLESPDGEPTGAFRGEPGLEGYDVRIGNHPGVPAGSVRAALTAFDRTLSDHLEQFDGAIRPDHLDDDLTADQLNAVIILCAWAHGEWVRIHPFPNGNGRTARVLVNSIAQRFGLPAFMRVRPRPGDEYEWVASEAMEGRWQSAIPLFTRLYTRAL